MAQGGLMAASTRPKIHTVGVIISKYERVREPTSLTDSVNCYLRMRPQASRPWCFPLARSRSRVSLPFSTLGLSAPALQLQPPLAAFLSLPLPSPSLFVLVLVSALVSDSPAHPLRRECESPHSYSAPRRCHTLSQIAIPIRPNPTLST